MLLDQGFLKQAISIARQFVGAPVPYQFSARETAVLNLFFTSTTRRVFFFKNLPPNFSAALLAMYSRLKNQRGIRGHFVDTLLPLLLTGLLENFSEVSPSGAIHAYQAYLDGLGIKSLDQFCEAKTEHRILFEDFVANATGDPRLEKQLADSPKMKALLDVFLDKYGHNSIARGAALTFAVEDVSILAAKSLEWNRLGSGFIELSTRFVDVSRARQYPIWEELATVNEEAACAAREAIIESSAAYKRLLGEKFDGVLPSFLETHLAKFLPIKDLKSAVLGESCDVAGNVLPCATLTSVGVAISGEAFDALLKHLILDGTPENYALVELILSEAAKVGGDQFARHYEPSEWDVAMWRYLGVLEFGMKSDLLLPRVIAEDILAGAFPGGLISQSSDLGDGQSIWDIVLRMLPFNIRGEHDKLPREFEVVGATFFDAMSFRSWRDLQRHVLVTHARTLVSPSIGFYHYDKPAPVELQEIFSEIHQMNGRTWVELTGRGVSPLIAQYAMAMGNLVGFSCGANLREWEFIFWQRSKFGVNHEVRQVVLRLESRLRHEYPWWEKISRTDRTPAYVAARGSAGVPLPPTVE